MDSQNKPKRKGPPPRSFFTPDDSSVFFYETSASIEEVIETLDDFELIKDDLTRTFVFTPVSHGYNFRYDVITPGIIKPKLSAYAEGHIWPNESGRTVIEGVIQIATSNNEILLITAMSLVPIPFLLLLPIVLFSVVSQRNDARQIKSQLDQAFRPAPTPEQDV